MTLFTSHDSALYPRENPEVTRLEAAVQEARSLAAPAADAAARLWRQENIQGVNPPPDSPYWPAKRAANDANQALEQATAAHQLALDAATTRARDAWNDNIRQQFLDDQPVIEAFIAMLDKYERFVNEAAEAGVSVVLNVPQIFLTRAEVASRLDYAKRALGV